MGGQIGVDSRPGQGSTFWVSIPMGRALAPRADEVAAQPHAADAWDGRRVLLVEDNPTNLIVAQTHLERMGLRVQTAEDGVQALDALRNGTYDIVLMDCQMPNMDGYEAVRRWREFEMSRRGLGRRLPIVALTANAMAEDRQRSLAAGYDDHLGKPFSGAELRQMLDHWLEVSVS
jgi:CheY-like chemotaxis protein